MIDVDTIDSLARQLLGPTVVLALVLGSLWLAIAVGSIILNEIKRTRVWCVAMDHPLRPQERDYWTKRSCRCGEHKVEWTVIGQAWVPSYWYDPWTMDRIRQTDFQMNRHREIWGEDEDA